MCLTQAQAVGKGGASACPVERYARFCRERASSGLLRALAEDEGDAQEHGLVNLAGNDYLGLSSHGEVKKRAAAFLARYGAGVCASRLAGGNAAPFAPIERKLARAKGCEAALLFSSGFQANVSLLAALLDRRVLRASPLLYADRLNHASLHMGCRLAGVRQRRYRHNDTEDLARLMERDRKEKGARFIVTESVFSMDGDIADISALAQLARRHRAFLYVDDAHATGVFGARGFGLACGSQADMIVGTFGKALGSFGAYVACSAALRDYLLQRCAGFIYTTALPPPVLGAIDAALDLVPALDARRTALLNHARFLRKALSERGFDCGASCSQIVPVLCGTSEAALDLSRLLRRAGFVVPAMRPPSVPAGASRVRFSLSAAHSVAQMERLVSAIDEGCEVFPVS